MKNDSDLLNECGFLKNDINRLNLEITNILIEQNDDYLEYAKKEEGSKIEKILNKKMEVFFSNLFEVVRHERLLNLLLSLIDPDILKQELYLLMMKKIL